MRRDQKGYTIAELLIAVTILAIVVAAVCGFIIVGSRSYAAGNSDINTQQEAQLALNQMSDVLIDTTRSVIYAAYNAAGDPEQALKDAEFNFTPEDKSLIMFNGTVVKSTTGGPDTIEAGNGNKHYHFYWNKAKETLFYAEQELDDPLCVDSADILAKFPDVANADPDADPATTKWYVLASHVTDFSVDLSQVEEKRVVQLALTFLDGTKEYVTSNNVTIRNKVGVNDVELEPLNRSVEIDISVKSSFVLEPGETFVLPTPKVTGKNVTDRTVTWSFGTPGPSDDGPGSDTAPGTALTTDGILTLSQKAKGTFIVRATTNAEDSEHNQPFADVTINVKRVTGIDLWKSADSDPGNGPNEISPGCTFTVKGRVLGDFLDQTCDCCGEDTSIDRHILSKKCVIESLRGERYVWRLWDPHLPGEEWALNDPSLVDWHPLDHIDEIDQDEYSATFKVRPDVPDGGSHGYVIQVMSLLSYYRYGPGWKGRSYDWVWPSISFKVVKSKNNINVNPGFKWGSVSNIDIGPDYPDGFNLTGQGYYLICARIKEAGSSNERIMIYGTTGNNPLVTPDLFGLQDVSKTWEISLQVIDPGQHFAGGITPGPGVILPSDPNSINDTTVRNAVKDYLENSAKNNGTYNGNLPHTSKFVGTLKPPVIYYKYDGRENITGELELKKATTLGGPEYTSFEIERVENTRGERDGVTAFTNNNIKFSIYKENAGGTEPIYWYDAGEKTYKGSSRAYDGMIQFGHFDKEVNMPQIQLDLLNGKNKFAEAAGRYRFVPSITYTQMANADTSYKVYYASYQPSYNVEQCYEVPESTVYYELQNGGNVEAFWSYNNEFTKGEIYFPTPSESGFTVYFDRENMNSNWQNAKNVTSWGPVFTKSIVGRSDITSYQPSSMRCHYLPDSKVYELELFYNYWDSTWNRSGEVSAGKFQCAVNGTEWKKTDRGTFDSQLESGNKNPQLGPTTANVEFKIGDKQYKGKLYIPLPSESAFSGKGWNELGFGKSEYPNFEVKEYVTLKYQPQGEQYTEDVQIPNVKCTYNAKTDMYGLILTYANGDVMTGFKIKSDGEQWTSPWMPWEGF